MPVRSTGSSPAAAGAVGQPSDAGSGIDPYDAVVLVSFGGPENPEDVVPFLRNVTRGRGIPEERLAQVGEHYFLLGGRSPINDQCRMLQEALQEELSDRGVEVPLYWGNRNWDPFLSDAFVQMAADGHRRVLAVTTSAYPSYSSCRQYRENLHDAAQGTAITVDRVRHYAHHPAFAAASVDATVAAVDSLGTTAEPAHLLFVTHSVPIEMARTSGPPPKTLDGGYVDWHRTLVA
jgi:ferrochelatase